MQTHDMRRGLIRIPPAHVRNARTELRNLIRELGALSAMSSEDGTTWVEGHILTELGQASDLTASDLARILVIDRTTASRALKRLEAQGYVERAPGIEPWNKRKRYYRMTPAGSESLHRLDMKVDREVMATLARIPEGDILGVIAGIARYARAAREVREGADSQKEAKA